MTSRVVVLLVSATIFAGDEEEMRRLILDNNVDVNEVEGATHLTLLEKAATANNETIIRALVELGADMNKAIGEGRTPMLISAKMNHVLAMKALAEVGADINLQDLKGRSPTRIAVGEGHVEATVALAELGANLDAADHEGNTPIHIAAKNGHHPIVKLLVQMGADVDITAGNNSVSPHCTAVRYGQTEVAEYLVSVGADLLHSLDHFEDADAFAGVHKLVQDFAQMATAGDSSMVTVCGLLSLTKLLTSVVLEAARHLVNNGEKAGDTGEDGRFATGIPEAELTSVLRNVLSDRALQTIQPLPYLLKRRLARIAWRVVREGAEALDGDRVTAETMARRYVEVYCLFHSPTMMRELLSLRMTCKSNHEAGRRRFPISRPNYLELEANMMEEWVAYSSSRFVSTEVLHTVLRIQVK